MWDYRSERAFHNVSTFFSLVKLFWFRLLYVDFFFCFYFCRRFFFLSSKQNNGRNKYSRGSSKHFAICPQIVHRLTVRFHICHVFLTVYRKNSEHSSPPPKCVRCVSFSLFLSHSWIFTRKEKNKFRFLIYLLQKKKKCTKNRFIINSFTSIHHTLCFDFWENYRFALDSSNLIAQLFPKNRPEMGKTIFVTQLHIISPSFSHHFFFF